MGSTISKPNAPASGGKGTEMLAPASEAPRERRRRSNLRAMEFTFLRRVTATRPTRSAMFAVAKGWRRQEGVGGGGGT
ncbi:hypothetical protein GCM10022384_55480 [Streptomyces marokkonensis]|uniref:Uncharacterized protein n=1 Tax=Streptomyces marokkonensis TaxID=324855 RepID=A0ABP7RSJ8_9ACTN